MQRKKLGKKKEAKGYFEGVDVVSERCTWLDVSDCFGSFSPLQIFIGGFYANSFSGRSDD